MATGYSYHPLDRARQVIRLLCFDTWAIEPAEYFNEPLRCTIRNISTLPDPLPEYYAVSYTWVDRKTFGSLLVDGKEVKIPSNAETALRHLLAKQAEQRGNPSLSVLTGSLVLAESPTATEFDEALIEWPSTETRFWLDAICINQHDLEEKSWQLLLISDIYSQAREVCIWLGEDKDGNGLEIAQSISSVVEQCKDETNNLGDLFERVWAFSSKELSPRSVLGPLPTQCNLGVLCSIYSSEWFQRLWVLQESILARNPQCYLGSHSLPFREIALAARWIWYRTFGRLFPGDHQYTAHTMGIQNAATMWDMMSTPFIVPRVLSNLLLLATRFEVTDPRDKVYAILGLLNDTDFIELEEGLLPDYSISLTELYTRVTRAIIEDTQSLFIMRIGSTMVPATERGEDALEMPSWVPRFDWVHDVNRGSPCAIRSIRRAESSNSRMCMRVLEGLPYLLTVQGIQVDTIRCNARECWAGGRNSIEAHISDAWDMTEKHASQKHYAALEEAFAYTICAGRNKALQDLSKDEHFSDHCAAFFSTCGASCQRLSDYFSQLVVNGKSRPTEDSQEIPKAMMQNGRNLRFFVTSHGRIGLGAKMARPGDTVCLIPGCEVPVILRHEGPFWRYVGDAYVYDLMQGGGMRQKTEEVEASLQWFNIQ